MTAPPANLVNKLIGQKQVPPMTTKFETVNFRNRNVFDKISMVPDKKNRKITEQIRSIIRNRVISKNLITFLCIRGHYALL